MEKSSTQVITVNVAAHQGKSPSHHPLIIEPPITAATAPLNPKNNNSIFNTLI